MREPARSGAGVDIDREALWLPLAAPEGASAPAHPRDWMGNIWSSDSFPNPFPLGWVGPRLPLAGDGFRAGALEWVGFALAAHFAAADDRPPTIVEMGASQAPWCLSWIRALQRLGVRRRLHAVAYEAADGRRATERFWSMQGLEFDSVAIADGLRYEAADWSFEWWRRAVVTGGGTVRFPDIDIVTDNGAQATRAPGNVDYRGRVLAHREVIAVDPVEAVGAAGFVHFLHLDIQGGEEEMIRSGQFRELSGKLAVVQLGTHSRVAEELAVEELPESGFALLDEEPSVYQSVAGRPTLVKDGEQLWAAPDVVAFLANRSYI